jgi:3-dehydroquinate synthase
MVKKIRVNLKDRSYNILIGSGNLAGLKNFLKSKRQVVIITDFTVGSLYAKIIQNNLKGLETHVISLPSGEKYKSLSAAAALYDRLINLQIHRDALFIALGGGVIGDLAGFVAATYMRGVALIQVPTTLLAMVDAAIGGKTAVNHHKGKNLIGVFHQPKLVLIDVDTLKTLPPREIKNGLAEVLKYGIIKDPRIIKILEGNPKVNAAFWQDLIFRCARIKAEVVSKDERELTGYRMILNFGHTIGHAVESLTGYKKYSHGEAIGFGMLAASAIALRLKLLNLSTYKRIKELIARLKLPIRIKLRPQSVIQALKLDKKVRQGRVKFVLPIEIGKVTIRDDVPENAILKVLLELSGK